MTYYGSKHLAGAFRTVRKNTIAIARDIPEDKYTFRASPDTRSVGQLLVHIAVTPSWQLEVHGQSMTSLESYDFAGRFMKAMAEEQLPRAKAQIVEMLEKDGEAFAAFLEALSESTLAEMVTLPARSGAPPKSRFEMLL